MNKQAQKLKAKRRAAKESAKLEQMNKLWDEMNEYATKTGRPILEKTNERMLMVYRNTKEANKNIMNKTGVIALVCSLVVLYKHYNFDKNAILKYAIRLRNFMLNIGKTRRPVSSFMEEIEKDYNVPILERCNKFPKVDMENSYIGQTKEEIIIKSTVENFPYFVTMNAYTFMNFMAYTTEKVWNSEDLELFISEVFKLYELILIDYLYLNTLNNILIDEVDINVNLEKGSVSEIIKEYVEE